MNGELPPHGPDPAVHGEAHWSRAGTTTRAHLCLSLLSPGRPLASLALTGPQVIRSHPFRLPCSRHFVMAALHGARGMYPSPGSSFSLKSDGENSPHTSACGQRGDSQCSRSKRPACVSGKAVTTEMLPCLCEDPGVPRAAARPRPVTGREGPGSCSPACGKAGRPASGVLAIWISWLSIGAGEGEEDGEKTASGTEVSGWAGFGSGPPSTFKSKYYQ